MPFDITIAYSTIGGAGESRRIAHCHQAPSAAVVFVLCQAKPFLIGTFLPAIHSPRIQ